MEKVMTAEKAGKKVTRAAKTNGPTDMESAMAEVRAGMSVAKAAKTWKVARSTLSNKLKGVTALNCRPGPSTILTTAEENLLVEWIILCGKRGFPITKAQLISSVNRLVRDLGRLTPFKNDTPGRKWFERFMKAHPVLSKRIPQNLTFSRGSLSKERILSWFEEVSTYFSENNLLDVIKEPRRVFNADEAAFMLNPKPDGVLFERGSKCVYGMVNVDDKESITVLLNANAEGEMPPPMVVLQYVRVPANIAETIPKTWAVGLSENGWMTGETFFEYVTNIFDPWLEESKIPRPVIFFVDGHVSHLTYHLSKFCESKGIILVALVANATHILQPMDIAVFRTLKSSWKEAVSDFRHRTMQPFVKKTDFFQLLKEAISSSVTKKVLANGFRKAGLLPWNSEAIDYSKIVSSGILKESSSDTIPERSEVQAPVVCCHDEWKVTLKKLNELMGEDKVEFYLSIMHSPDWTEIVDPEDQTLFTLWRHIYSTAQSIEDVPNTSISTERQTNNEAEKQTGSSIHNTINDNLPRNTDLPCSSTSLSPTVFEILESRPAVQVGEVSPPEITPVSTPVLNLTAASHSEVFTNPGSSKDTLYTESLNTPASAHLFEVFTSPGSSKDTLNTKSLNTPKSTSVTHQISSTDRTPVRPVPGQNSSSPQVPSPFKRALFWPGERRQLAKKRKIQEKIPSVASSKAWQVYHEKKIKEKEEQEKEREKRKVEREEKKLLKLQNKGKKKNQPRTKAAKKLIFDEGEEDVDGDVSAWEVGDYVIVDYEEEYFPGQILKVEDDKAFIKTMKMAGIEIWKWPLKHDVCYYEYSDIKIKIQPPSLINKRGHYKIPEMKTLR